MAGDDSAELEPEVTPSDLRQARALPFWVPEAVEHTPLHPKPS